jgi:hypothetical protein
LKCARNGNGHERDSMGAAIATAHRKRVILT